MRNKYCSLIFCTSILLVALNSCASKQNIFYFQGNEQVLQNTAKYTPVLQPDDLLVITVSALDVEATLPFNQVNPYNANNSNMQQSLTSGNPRLITYLIDEKGEINFPVLGKLRLAGMTRSQAMDMMKQKVAWYIKDPTVNISLVNFRITVLGEVARPGAYTIADEKITLPEALGLAGDLTIYGLRKDILVVREKNNEKEFYHVDLTSQDMFSSPVYYLSQNDVVYVQPNNARVQSSQYSSTSGLFISVAGIIISVISLLSR